MNLDLSGKTAIVCGSTQGLGWASAYELSLLGARVILMARNEEKLKDRVKGLHGNNDHGYIVADFSDVANVEKAIGDWVRAGNTAHILVNNTGGPASGKIMDAEVQQFAAAFESHLLCNHVLVNALAKGMKDAGYGRIINIISTSVKAPLAGLGVSNTIRAAVANWSKTLSNELAQFGITVNNVLPGFTQTTRADYILQKKAKESGKSPDAVMVDMIKEIPMGRIGQPEELGAAVAFLASPAASYITGINLPVDGGRTPAL